MGNEATLNQLVNEQEKAVFKSMKTDMETGKALLNVEQLGYFLREATLENTILRDADFKLMKSFKKHLNRTGINGRVLTNVYDVDGVAYNAVSSTTVANTEITPKTTYSVSIGTLNAKSGSTIDARYYKLYVWFEGQDEDCADVNAGNALPAISFQVTGSAANA